MRILVTGATGFVGRHLLKELLTTNHEIIVTTSNEEKIKNFNFYSKVSVVVIDLNNIDTSKNYFDYLKRPNLVLHLAWQGLPNYHQLFHFEKNLIEHYTFLKNLIENGLEDLVVTGTCFEYGMKEGCLYEDMISDPQNAYALAKDTLRKFLEQLQAKHSYELKWIRLFYMYGGGQNPNSLLSQLESTAAKGDKIFNMSGGEQERDYLPVEKIGHYLKVIALQNKINGIINCCSGKPVKIIDLVEDFMKKRNIAIQLNKGYYPYAQDEPMSFWGNTTKLNEIIKSSQ